MIKFPRPKILSAIVGFLILSGIIVHYSFEYKNSSLSEKVSSGRGGDVRIPPAPPVVGSRSARAGKSLPLAVARPEDGKEGFRYEESASFEKNLNRLEEFCLAHGEDQRLQILLSPFLNILFSHAKYEFPTIQAALNRRSESTAYRNLLLACLNEADAPISEKSVIIWKMAMDLQEPIEVRRTAAFLTGQLRDGESRPKELYALLQSGDSEIVQFAVENAGPHLDQRNYDLIRTKLVASSNIYLRLAAITAVANAPFADNQAALKSLLVGGKTSKDEPFSESSLVKRAAIVHLDLRDPLTVEAVRRIALDESEDPGVRAKAIGRFTPSQFPNEIDMLIGILKKTEAENVLPLRAAADALLEEATPERIQLIRDRANEISDPDAKRMLLQRIRIATKGVGL